jgi:hypothetical protein
MTNVADAFAHHPDEIDAGAAFFWGPLAAATARFEERFLSVLASRPERD